MPGSSRRCCDRPTRRTSRDLKYNYGRQRCDDEQWSSSFSSSDSEVEESPFVGRYIGSEGCLATESVRQVATVCGTHTYTMVGYTLARAMGSGTRLCSDMFEVGGQLFRLEVYPAGLNAGSHKYVSLFLTTPGSTQPGHLLYELSIVDKSTSKPQHITESRTASAPGAPPNAATVMAPQAGVVAGLPKFIKANFLHRNARRFLSDDTLTVRATVKMLTGWSSFPVPSASHPQLFCLTPGAAATPLPLQPLPSPPSPPVPLPPPQYLPQATYMPLAAAPSATAAAASSAYHTSPPQPGGVVCSCGGCVMGQQHGQQGLAPGAPPLHSLQPAPAWQGHIHLQQLQPQPPQQQVQQQHQQLQPLAYGGYGTGTYPSVACRMPY